MFDIGLKAARAFLRASFAFSHSLFHQMTGLALIGLERVNDLGGGGGGKKPKSPH